MYKIGTCRRLWVAKSSMKAKMPQLWIEPRLINSLKGQIELYRNFHIYWDFMKAHSFNICILSINTFSVQSLLTFKPRLAWYWGFLIVKLCFSLPPHFGGLIGGLLLPTPLPIIQTSIHDSVDRIQQEIIKIIMLKLF